ncbi:MAG: hypothetical protein SGPRY_014599, partial [Prymnesium sp.]
PSSEPIEEHIAKMDSIRSVESDDLVSPMSIETYVLYRARPIAASLEQAAPRLVRTLQMLELLVFSFNSLGAVLALTTVGSTSLASFVAVSVSFASVISSMIEYHNLQQQVGRSGGGGEGGATGGKGGEAGERGERGARVRGGTGSVARLRGGGKRLWWEVGHDRGG